MLLSNGVIKLGEVLHMQISKVNVPRLNAIISKDGLILEGDILADTRNSRNTAEEVIYSPTSAATYVLNNHGFMGPAEGWLFWCTESGEQPASLYKRACNPPVDTHNLHSELRQYVHQFSQYRDATFVFGAGISLVDGAPLQRDLVDMIFA